MILDDDHSMKSNFYLLYFFNEYQIKSTFSIVISTPYSKSFSSIKIGFINVSMLGFSHATDSPMLGFKILNLKIIFF